MAIKKQTSPDLAQTIVDWVNPFSSKVPGDPIGGNVAAIPSQAANKFNQATQAPADLFNGVSTGVTSITDAVDYVVNNAKYAAIWAGLFVLGLVLIVKGLGVSTPSPSKIVPVPV